MFGLLIKPLSRIHPRAIDFIQLMRLDRPIGVYLLLWPTLCALWLAAEGIPDPRLLIVFIAGVMLMRAAGCAINDFADRKIDGHISRTKNRPLATGKVTAKEALVVFAILVTLSASLLLFTNLLTFQLALAAVALATFYPFSKRFTFYPQIVLGAAYSMAIPMAFAAQTGELPAALWLLYIANLLWTVSYDTEYAMSDRPDDLLIGVKSTAVLFGDADRPILAVLQGLVIFCLLLVGSRFALGGWYLCGVAAMLLSFGWQHWLIRNREPQACLAAFLSNHWSGLLLFIGVFLHYYFN